MATECNCFSCLSDRPSPMELGFTMAQHQMAVCEICGNKRCPKATDHRFTCTGSNDIGQAGSRYGLPQGLNDGS